MNSRNRDKIDEWVELSASRGIATKRDVKDQLKLLMTEILEDELKASNSELVQTRDQLNRLAFITYATAQLRHRGEIVVTKEELEKFGFAQERLQMRIAFGKDQQTGNWYFSINADDRLAFTGDDEAPFFFAEEAAPAEMEVVPNGNS